MNLIRAWYIEKTNNEIMQITLHGIDVNNIDKYKKYINALTHIDKTEDKQKITNADIDDYKNVLRILQDAK